MAKYFIFDMDQTLADPSPAFYFISALRLSQTTEDIKNAYNKFVNDILAEETSEKPLGILRPGILQVMNKLNELQQKGTIESVIIYSNNGHLETLEFIRDLIHLYIGSSSLINECIHWHHPMRDSERIIRPGVPNKTWAILKNILQEGNCKAPSDLKPSDVYFFDDLDHKDLQSNLGPNYYKVPPYSFKASVDRLAELYKNALNGINIKEYIQKLNENKFKFNTNCILDCIIKTLKKYTKGTVSTDIMPLKPDSGIDQMMEAIYRVEHPFKGGNKKRYKTYKRKMRQCCFYCFKCRTRRRRAAKKIETNIDSDKEYQLLL